MRVEIVSSLAEPVGTIWKNHQSEEKGHFFVASPLSSTPLSIYRWIVEHAGEFSSWDNVRFVLMDEMLKGDKPPFAYVPLDDPASYEGFAQKNFLTPLEKKTGVSVHVSKPHPKHIESFSKPLNLLILALGVQGNYANVMPGTPESTGWHVSHLTPEFRQSHTQGGGQSYGGANFREYGMSLGPQQVLSAENVVVIISGEKKRELAKKLLSYTSFDESFPLSIIYHPEVIEKTAIYATEDVGIDPAD
jgi:6-phosphogluconolactonase/glucosamine-6-phosphate isomerase/deaminase